MLETNTDRMLWMIAAVVVVTAIVVLVGPEFKNVLSKVFGIFTKNLDSVGTMQ